MAECPRGERILPPREVARLSDVSCNGKDSGSVGRRALCFEEIDIPLLDDETWPKRLDCSRKPEIRASPRFYRYCSTCTLSTFFFDDTEREERERVKGKRRGPVLRDSKDFFVDFSLCQIILALFVPENCWR